MPAGPNPPATVPLTGFLNLSVVCSSKRPSYHFQTGNALGVASSRGFASCTASTGSSPTEYPLDVVPAGCAASVLGRSANGHEVRFLGDVGTTPFVVFRVFVRTRIRGVAGAGLVHRRPSCPSWTFVLPWSRPSKKRQTRAQRPSRLGEPTLQADRTRPALHGTTSSKAADLSRD